MRLIDADLLDEEVMHLFITITGKPKQHTVVNECKSSFRRMIEEQPTVEPVRGEWLECQTNNGYYECSSCGRLHNKFYQGKTKYCPNCGADMRGEKND